MRAVVQRVKQASVSVDGSLVSKIQRGHLVFLGVESGDTRQDLEYMVDKIVNLRVFEDDQEKMNLSVKDVGGELLVVSQFTLCGDCRKGRRPSFSSAAGPEDAEFYYEEFCRLAEEQGIPVKKGVFRAHMEVSLINDGPVTMLLDSKRLF
ncbi:MAG TPA: D-tyrosyl-tRNA(Tyr) deacylase [Clostridiales bacterium]|nr:D-tyrosyl-tRNA(Tyr) deacylase [Clostridiales bacterium]